MSWNVDPVVKTALGIAGNIFAILLFASPSITFLRIVRRKSVEEFRALPYLTTFLNCSLWTFYGLPFVTKDAVLIVTVNGTGTVLQSIYLTIYLIYAPKKKKLSVGLGLLGVLTFFLAVALVAMLAMQGRTRQMFLGSLGAALATAMYASPLSVMRQVIATRSVEFMPFWLSLMSLLSSCSWASYGLYVRDYFVMVPNTIGVFLAMAQMILYFTFWKSSPREGKRVPVEGLTLASNGAVQSISRGANRNSKDDVDGMPTVYV